MNLTVGQKIYLKPNYGRTREKEIKEWYVKKIGRKYFEVYPGEQSCRSIKYRINDFSQVTEYTPDYYIYFDKQAILDEEESLKLTNDIREVLSHYGSIRLSLDQLREIHKIIKQG